MTPRSSRRPSGTDARVGLRASLRRADFRRAGDRGRRFQTDFFVVFRLERGDLDEARLGITVTRKIGGAVRRNRIKRLVREWFRGRQEELKSCDLVVIARRDIPKRPDLWALAADLDRALDFAPRRAPF